MNFWTGEPDLSDLDMVERAIAVYEDGDGPSEVFDKVLEQSEDWKFLCAAEQDELRDAIAEAWDEIAPLQAKDFI